MFRTALLLFSIALALAQSAKADVVMKPLPPSPGQATGSREYIQIRGQIASTDPQSLREKLSQWGGAISLDSPGGDVQAAIEIGRILRKENRDAVVDRNAVCASACVFALAGAPYRLVAGKVGIHRPFLPNDTVVDPTKQKERYKVWEREVKSYLEEVNVNPALYDDMLRISPGSIRFLSSSELERYGLSGADPYVQEAGLANSANLLRISKQELLKRRARIEAECVSKIAEEYGACAVAIEYGITLAEYKRRDALAQTECAKEPDNVSWVRCHTRLTRGF